MILYFFAALGISLILTPLVGWCSRRASIVDRADGERKINWRPVPLLGGLAVFLSFFIVAGYLLLFHPMYDTDIFAGKMTAVFIAGLILLGLGYFDDKYGVPAKWRLFISALAALIVVFGGVGLDKVTNPFGGYLLLNLLPLNFFGQTIYLIPVLLIFLWLLGMMYTVKITDGLDGLSTGIVAIGAFMIFLLTTTTKYYQPNVGLLALVFFGSCLGFWYFNFYPAKVYLGEGGGLFLGLLLGVLSVIAGGKLATALLVMAVPILDLIRVIFVRWRHKQSIWQGDREHLHFRLLDAGLGHPQTVAVLYCVAALFGALTLFLQSSQKLIALIILFILMLVVGFWLSRKKYDR